MKRYLPTLIICSCAQLALAQVDVRGTVLDQSNGSPLRGASVTVKGANGKIRKFAATRTDGSFSLPLDSIGGNRLEVSMLNFAKQSLALDSVELPLVVYLEPKSTMLKEVMVKADRIREQGDTISYSVGAFAQKQDRSIGDVLARMPGMKVESSGRIQYQGEDINKFYIEGSDLLGGRYGIATNGIRHDDVGAVEVMENHQPMQVLAGIAFSDKAAINLKLKNRAKATWTFHGTGGGGYSWQPQGAIWDGELFAMAVMPAFQSITTLKSNNTGRDLSDVAADFFASQRGTALRQSVSVSLPMVPNLARQRTAFNRSLLASSNFLWKVGRGEVKTQVDYSRNHLTSDAYSSTTYFLPDGNRVISEERHGEDRSQSLSGKVIYELNRRTAFVNNTLRTNLDWDDVSLRTAGTLTTSQSAALPDYFVSNNLKVIKRFRGKHLVSFSSVNEWESMPQSLVVGVNGEGYGNPSSYASPSALSLGTVLTQNIRDYAFVTNESAAYTLVAGGVTMALEGGVKGYFRTFRSELPALPAELPGETVNVVSTNYLSLYAEPKFEYNLRRVNFTLNLPVSAVNYTFDNSIADGREVYCTPALSINWKPSNRFEARVRGSVGRSPMSLNLIYPGLVMTDYRTFRSGVGDFYNTGSRSLSSSVSYKFPSQGLFANAMALQSWGDNPYTLSQRLYGNYIVYSYSPAKSDRQMFMTRANIGKTLDFMRGSTSLSGSYTRQQSNLLSQGAAVANQTTLVTAGWGVSGSPLRFLTFDYKLDAGASRMLMNQREAPWLRTMVNTLLINVMPHRKWEWHLKGEHYANELTAKSFKTMLLMDTKLIYKPTKRLELAASLTNVLNHKEYSYTSYTQLSQFESRSMLRGRELLLSLTIKK